MRALALILVVTLMAFGLWRACAPGYIALPPTPPPHEAPSPPVTDGEEPSVEAPDRTPYPSPSLSIVIGQVRGPIGEPEPGVRVLLRQRTTMWPDERFQPLGSALTGTDGRFQFRARRAEGLQVVADKDGLARAEAFVSPREMEVIVDMVPGYRVAGVVQGPGAGVEAGCEVILEPSTLSRQRAISTRTDIAGRFVFDDVPAGSARLTARHPTFRPATLPSIVVGTRVVHRIRFGQASPLRIAGVVTAGNGSEAEPVVDAVIRAYPSSWNSRSFLPVRAKTDMTGRYELFGIGQGNYRIEVSHPRFSTRTRQVTVNESVRDFAVELGGRSRLSGALVGDGGVAEVAVVLEQAGLAPQRATTDASGRFAFPERISGGKAHLRLEDDRLCFAQTSSRWVEIDAEEGGPTEVELQVAAAGLVTGLVRDVDGQPLTGVRVLWRDFAGDSRNGPTLLAITDENGRYRVLGVPRPAAAGAAFLRAGAAAAGFGLTTFVFRHRGNATVEVRFSAVAPGQTLELDPVDLVPPGRIEGLVTRDGRGVQGAFVTTGAGPTAGRRAVTGPGGRFVLRDLAPGEYRIRARHAAMPLAVSDDWVAVASGAVVEGVDVKLRAGRTIRGRVVDPQGTPVLSALVVVRDERQSSTFADASGEFDLEVQRGDVELQVFANVDLHGIHVQRTVRVPRGQDEVTVELPIVPSGTVSARVRGLPQRRPLAGAILRLRALDGGGRDEARDAQRNVRSRWVEMNGGELRLARFPAGRSELVLHVEGFAPFVTDVHVRPGLETDLGLVLLERGARVRGVVRDAEGAPVPSARVWLGDVLDVVPASARSPASMTDANGAFSIEGVAPRAGTLVVSAEGFAQQVRELRIPADLLRPEPFAVVLNRGATIAVTIDEGRADTNRSVVLLVRGGQIIDRRWSEPGGEVRFEHCSPGAYRIEEFGVEGSGHVVDVVEGTREYAVRLQ